MKPYGGVTTKYCCAWCDGPFSKFRRHKRLRIRHKRIARAEGKKTIYKELKAIKQS